MAFQMPEYHQPDFSKEQFIKAPDAKWEIVEIDGVAPEYFHSTSMFPEYFKIQGKWVLAEESRMDSSVVICPDGHLEVVENRNLKKGDKISSKKAAGSKKVTRLFLDGAKPARREFMSTVQDSRQKRTRLRINLCSARDEAGRPPMRETMTA